MDSEGRSSASSVAGATSAPAPSESARPQDVPPTPPPPRSDGPSDGDWRTTAQVISDLHIRFHELIDYIGYFLLTRIDAAKHYAKLKILWLSLILFGVLAGAGAVVTGVVLLCTGIADGLSVLLGHVWAGELATGVILVGATLVSGTFMFGWLIRQSHRERIDQYDAFRARFRERYGHDIGKQRGGEQPGDKQAAKQRRGSGQ